MGKSLIHRLENMKKSYARVLACIVEGADDGGVTSESISKTIPTVYGKLNCPEDAIDTIVCRLAAMELLTSHSSEDEHGNTTNTHSPTEDGITLYKMAQNSRPELFAKTTSPLVPMYA